MKLQTYHLPQGGSSPAPAARFFKVGSSLILCCLAIALCNEGSGFLRKLCTLDVYFTREGDHGPYGVWSELYMSDSTNYYERATLAVPAAIPPNNINFVLSMLECPELAHQGIKEDQPPNELFFDMISMLKYSLCKSCVAMTIGGVQYTTTIQALIPGDAVECMGPNGEPFDRIKILEDLKIGVQMLGSPIGKGELASDYLRDNVDTDVGIKDLVKLRALNMTGHEVVVLVDSTTMPMQPIEPIVEMFLNSDAPAAYSMDYAPPGVPATPTNQGCNTGFMLVKPSTEEFNAVVDTYKTTEFDPTTGWAGSGVGGFPGCMGTSGILTHYYKTKTPSPMVLGKCEYNNDFETHLDANGACRDGSNNCPNCQETPASEVVIARLNDKACGKPYDCPDNSALTGTLCDDIHKKWYSNRVEYEDKHFKREKKSQRKGTFKIERTLGFCSQEGPQGYEKLLPDAETGPIPLPEPATIPPEQAEQGCPNACNAGEYMKEDCSCTSDECDACPQGTRCQRKGNGVPALCIDCECGFCNYAGEPCCNFNGVNNCKAASSAKECKLQNGYFPGWPGAGNACAGVEISATATPNGCGCKPNESTPCTYDASAAAGDDKCFIVTARELLASHPEQTAVANSCKACLDSCDPCISGKGQDDTSAMMSCLGKTIGKKNEECRSNCAPVCKH